MPKESKEKTVLHKVPSHNAQEQPLPKAVIVQMWHLVEWHVYKI
jgi:hypothetical protein